MNPYSNAPAGYPDTSEGGYPYWYAIGGDGLAVGPPRLIYDGQTFADEADIEVYKVRSKSRDANIEAWRLAHEAERHNGLHPAMTIQPAEGWLLWDAARGKDDSFWRRMLSGTNADIARVKQAAFYTLPPGWTKARFPREGSRWQDVAEIWD